MGRYICGPSRLRFEGRQAIVPGELFEEGLTPEHEALLLKAGAIRLAPEDPPAPSAPAGVRPSRRSPKKETEE